MSILRVTKHKAHEKSNAANTAELKELGRQTPWPIAG
jgi:hypothetical protein